jgi:magnesium chelatase accessory protein
VTDHPQWELEGRDWPNREHSRFPLAKGLRWHVQRLGRGPALLLLHGTGAATHSWRDLAPRLAQCFEVIAPDLPGHGFTQAPPSRELSLTGMARALGELLRQLGVSPALVAGHSAGAAILARMCLDGCIRPRALISLNGALLPLHGLPGHLFSPAARLLAAAPLVPRLFARRAASPGAVERLVESTGSRIDRTGMELYRRLIVSPGHVAATLSMMANWELEALGRELPRLEPALVLVVAERDGTVRPAEAGRVLARVPSARVVRLAGLGHLAHEEQPEEIADLIREVAVEVGVLREGEPCPGTGA